jgi:hypothetical protein
MKTFKQYFTEEDDNLWHLRVTDEPFPDSVPISDDDYREIKHLLKGKGFADEVIEQLAKQSNVSLDTMKKSFRIILQQDEFETAVNYLRSRETDSGVTKEKLIESGNIFNAFGTVGFEKKTLKDLYELREHSQPVMGKGELLLVTLLKGCTKPSKGDIAIDGSTYDVKGVSARLRGQRGFAIGASATKVWSDWFNNLNQEKNLGLEVPPAGANNWHIKPGRSKKDPNVEALGFLINTGSSLVINDIITDAEYSNIIKQGLRAVYTDLSDQELSFVDVFCKNLKTKGIDRTFLLREYANALVQYYLRVEDLADTGVFAFGKQGQVKFFNANSGNILDMGINVDLPSFGSSAGPQGSAAGINVI